MLDAYDELCDRGADGESTEETLGRLKLGEGLRAGLDS